MRHVFNYERRGQPPAPASHFAWRLFVHALIVIALGGLSLFVGMLGTSGSRGCRGSTPS